MVFGFASLATFQIVFSFFCAENIQFFGFGVYRFAVFPFLEFSLKLLKKSLRFFGFGICCLVSVREFSFSARAITFDVNFFLRCNLRDLRLQNMAENEVNEFHRKEGHEVIVDCVENCAV